MNASKNPAKAIGPKVLLSTLWVIVMLNMLKADVLSLYIPGTVDRLVNGAGETAIPLLMLFFGAVPMEVAIVMIILSRVLKYATNRWVNIIVGMVMIAYVWVGATPYPHYIFIATVETLCLLLIIGGAWKWLRSEE